MIRCNVSLTSVRPSLSVLLLFGPSRLLAVDPFLKRLKERFMRATFLFRQQLEQALRGTSETVEDEACISQFRLALRVLVSVYSLSPGNANYLTIGYAELGLGLEIKNVYISTDINLNSLKLIIIKH